MGQTSVFDEKIFNGEVFEGYIATLPNPNRNELIRSRAIRQRPDLAASMVDKDGGNYITTQLVGRINGQAPQNYDGGTDFDPGKLGTMQHARVVVGRMRAWTEKDFSFDLTGGHEFIEDIAAQIAEYWEDVDQGTIIAILNGVFNMTDPAGAEFVTAHTYDVTAKTNKEGTLGEMDGTTLNTAIQRASGDNKGRFTLAIMHSYVATNLENMKLFAYLKYTDANGMERDLAFGTLNGRLVLVDDAMPTITHPSTAGVHTVTIAGTPAANDELTCGGVTVKLTAATAASVTTAAAALLAALQSDYTMGTRYSMSASAGVITLTEKAGSYGVGKPAVSKSTGAGSTITAATTTEAGTPKTAYITYVLGDGAIEYTDCGAKVPYEVDRDPKTNGGQDTLYSRQRKCFAPWGISFTNVHMASNSPTDAELQNGENWELVSSKGDTKEYIPHKLIPLARIISLG